MSKSIKLDSREIQEWRDALEDVLENQGQNYTQSLMDTVVSHWTHLGGDSFGHQNTPYRNTYVEKDNLILPESDELGQEAFKITLWNAMAMVVRAGKIGSELGGHISTYASIGSLYQVGFDYFFKGDKHPEGQDLVFFQGHSSPGIYARSHLEGRFQDSELNLFRQETQTEKGLSSYPHPWLMPEYWQFPTVSMGLGPMQAIYTARWLRYLEGRGIHSKQQKNVWAFCGDGEMDEPESLGCISMPVREKLDNLIFVINCNLQRLDGPVRGNGKIMQELERIFRGAGWRVLKLVWNSAWDKLLRDDQDGRLQKALDEIVDGQYQSLISQGPQALLDYFSKKDTVLAERFAGYKQDFIEQLAPGGHDPVKIYTVYKKAVTREGKPVVILAHTIKGYGLGKGVMAANTTHQQKKLQSDAMIAYGQNLHIPITKEAMAIPEYYRPNENSPAIQHIKRCRENLGGVFPSRKCSSEALSIPGLEIFKELLQDTGTREISTTMAFVRGLTALLKDPSIKERIVPIVPDESRTFGMEGLFRQVGIYASTGQTYEPVDAKQIMYYREAKDGQLLQEGINEAGAVCSWMAAATSYTTCNTPMIPFYIYYSMFGFQRVGDFLWAAADMRARGFLLGATAGRTTLAGEGLQHNDGHSHILSSVVPNCKSYDPCFHYELAVIMKKGMDEMYKDLKDVFYYVTVMNENYLHPSMPKGVEGGIIQGMYTQPRWRGPDHQVHLLGSGTILIEVLKAVSILAKFGINCCVWSVTSFTELAREGQQAERENVFNSCQKSEKTSYVSECLKDGKLVIAATDYMRAYAEQIRPFVPGDYTVLGTDGFGRSDTRKALRSYFGVNAQTIAYVTAKKLSLKQKVSPDVLKKLAKECAHDIGHDPLTR